MDNTSEAHELRLREIKARVIDGFYFSQKIYELIAEKVLKELLCKK